MFLVGGGTFVVRRVFPPPQDSNNKRVLTIRAARVWGGVPSNIRRRNVVVGDANYSAGNVEVGEFSNFILFLDHAGNISALDSETRKKRNSDTNRVINRYLT